MKREDGTVRTGGGIVKPASVRERADQEPRRTRSWNILMRSMSSTRTRLVCGNSREDVEAGANGCAGEGAPLPRYVDRRASSAPYLR